LLKVTVSMKRTLCLTLISAGFLAIMPSARPQEHGNEEKLLALIKEVQAQQAQIADNQGKIDQKLAEVADSLREARIFAGRGGK
jgi:hypothetical protein